MSFKTMVVAGLIAFAILMMLVGGGTRDNTAMTIFVWILAVLAIFLLPKGDDNTEEDKR